MNDLQHDGNELPDAKGFGGKIATLERRVEHLDRRIESGRGSVNSIDMDRGERSALVKAALPAMRWVRSKMDGGDNPVLALAALVYAIDAEHLPKLDSKTEAAMTRARAVLAEWNDAR